MYANCAAARTRSTPPACSTLRRKTTCPKPPDRITPDLILDDEVFKPILQSLYSVHGSPYRFGVLPAEILGTVYERFLGKVIRLTPRGKAKVESKAEILKARGVYYTPAYIVDYIVEHTVAADRVPKPCRAFRRHERAASPRPRYGLWRRLFPFGVYRYLLDYCLKWYVDHKPETHRKAVCKEPRNGPWRLTIEEKKRILRAHVFGVDIDPRAVEVTKLSLLLKMLEGENDETMDQQSRLFHERALGNLADNVRCGNSLIGPDYGSDQLTFGPDDLKRINAFDWAQGFPDAPSAADSTDHRKSTVSARVGLQAMDGRDRSNAAGKKVSGPANGPLVLLRSPRPETPQTGRNTSFIVNAYWTAGTGRRN